MAPLPADDALTGAHPSTSSGCRSARQLLEPPKPKELDSATRIRRTAGLAAHEVEIAVRVRRRQVRVHRQDAAMDRQRADRRLDRAGGGDQVAHELLVELTPICAGVGAEHRADRGALAAVVHERGRAVGVQVVDVFRPDAGIRERLAHRLDRAVAGRMGIGDAIAAERVAVAGQLGVDARPAPAGRAPTLRARGSPRLRRARSRCAWRRRGGWRAPASRCPATARPAGRSSPGRSG